MARAAAAPPSTAATKRHHPPYKEMILSAVAALKEKKGSSRAAIAKFIAASYSDLPATHDALLSTHLRRLRDQGRLLMLKHSYKLPSPPSPPSASAPTRRPGRPPGSALVVVEVHPEKRRPGRPRKAGLGAAPPAEKRRPGRPPKLSSSLSNPVALMALPVSTFADAAVLSERRKPGRPRKQPLALDLVGKRKRGRPMKMLSLGLAEDATVLAQRRKRGRPPKQQFSAARALAPHSVGKRKPGRPPKVLLLGSSAHDAVVAKLRKPGRPPKYPPVAPALALVSTVSAGRRKPGRPPKVSMVSSSLKGTDGNVLATKRKPGRPPKYPLVAPVAPPDSNFVTNGAVEGLIYLSGISMAHSNSDVVPAPALTVTTEKRKPGRPKKVSLLASPIKGAAAGVGPTGRKRGRPPKSQVPSASVAVEEMADSGEKMGLPGVIPHAEV